MVKWAEEFKKINPEVKIDVSAGGAGKGMTDVLSNMVDIAMVSREIYPDETKKGATYYAVAKDAVIPVISTENPALKEILTKGIKKDAAIKIWISGTIKSWNQLCAGASKSPMHIYTRSDACGAAEIWAKYMGKKQEDLLGSGVYGDPGLALAVKKDALGIGYNNIGYAYDSKTKKQISGICVLPLDINNNGKIDTEENFYNSLDDLIQAIATGKYPSPPARELFLVTKGKPKSETASAFIKWILSSGQKFINDAGYIKLSDTKLAEEIKKTL
jgi:phosphate transport system substrate-binding protein